MTQFLPLQTQQQSQPPTQAPSSPSSRFFPSKARSLLLALFLTPILGGATWFYLNPFSASSEVLELPVILAERSDLQQTINQTGIVTLGQQQAIKSPGEVTVEQVLVKPGDRVTPGQTLIHLRDRTISGADLATSPASQAFEIREQELQLEQYRLKQLALEAQLTVAQAELLMPQEQQLEIEQYQAAIARSQQKIREAQLKLQSEQSKLKDDQALAEQGVIATKSLRQQIEAARLAEAALKDAELELKTQRIQLQKAQADTARLQPIQAKIRQLQLQIQTAELEELAAQQALQKLRLLQQEQAERQQRNRLKSPIAGIVLAVQVNPGEGVSYDKVLITLGDPATEQVKLQLGTWEASQVQPGQPVQVRVIGPDAASFNGAVQSIEPQAVAQTASASPASGGGQPRVPAVIELERPSQQLIPGSQVAVSIVVAERKQVMTLDLAAIQQSAIPPSPQSSVQPSAQPFVWILNADSQAQKRTVQLGLETDTQVEIVQGLETGDRVILVDESFPMIEGMTVIPVSAGADDAIPLS